MAIPSEAHDVAQLALEQNPNIASRTLARILFENDPKLFKSIDNARSTIRNVRGLQGNKHRVTAQKIRPHLVKDIGWQLNEMPVSISRPTKFLYWLRKAFPKAQILYKIGNHEDRMERFLVKNAPVFLGVPDFEVAELLKFRDMGIELVKSLQLVRFGKLPVYHGHELPQGISSPVNPARGLWMRVQETCVAGHWHRVSEHTEKTGISDKISSCWSLGCLCDMKPDYASVNRWSAGFATVETDKGGEFEFHNKKIIQGRVF